jgi:hypothetical protein
VRSDGTEVSVDAAVNFTARFFAVPASGLGSQICRLSAKPQEPDSLADLGVRLGNFMGPKESTNGLLMRHGTVPLSLWNIMQTAQSDGHLGDYDIPLIRTEDHKFTLDSQSSRNASGSR